MDQNLTMLDIEHPKTIRLNIAEKKAKAGPKAIPSFIIKIAPIAHKVAIQPQVYTKYHAVVIVGLLILTLSIFKSSAFIYLRD